MGPDFCRGPLAYLSLIRGAGEVPESLGILAKSLINPCVHGALFPGTIRAPLPRRHSGENLDPLVDGSNRPDVELALAHGLDHLLSKHEVTHARRGDDHSLAPG